MTLRYNLNLSPSIVFGFLYLYMISVSWAGFTGVSGNIDVSNVTQQGNPGFDDFRRNQISDDTNMLLFVEQQQLTLTSALAVNSTAPGTYNAGNLPPGGTIASGTTIDSWLLHQDTDTSVKTFSATITFDAPILGVIVHPTQLDNSDFLAGCCVFDTGYNRRGSLLRNVAGNEPTDNYTVSADGMTLSITMRTNSQNLDEIRIITGGTNTVPITLGYFHAEREVNTSEVLIRWQTVTEIGNVGFNLYGATEQDKSWRKLNHELIISPVGESTVVQKYEYLSIDPVVTRFAISDVDFFGKETIHGPFKLGKTHGVNRADRKQTDWAKIRKENKAKKVARKVKRLAARAKRMKQFEGKLDTTERQIRREIRQKPHLDKRVSWQNGALR